MLFIELKGKKRYFSRFILILMKTDEPVNRRVRMTNNIKINKLTHFLYISLIEKQMQFIEELTLSNSN